jgi:localization factor PodJL
MEEDAMPVERAHLDAWGMPQSNASRRDTEDMLARVGRSETESSEAFRRIEEQLRGVARRLDSSERSHSESNRVLSRTAQEINIATREQSQAFDQLGLNVMALSERLERVERTTANDGIRDAVKALHQGLSRLADQVTQTANNSATQAGNLASNLEQLAARVGAARVDAEDADKQLAQRILTVENVGHKNATHLDDRLTRLESGTQVALDSLEKRLAAVQTGMEAGQAALEQRIENRLANAEKAAQVHTSAIDHALEKIEGAAAARAADQVEAQRRAGFVEENLQGLRDAIERLETRGSDVVERRLDQVERHVGGLIERLEHHDAAAPLQEMLDTLTRRIETLEKDHTELLAELRTGGHPGEPSSGFAQTGFAPSAFAPSAFPQEHAHQPGEPPAPPAGAFEAPPFPEPQSGVGYSSGYSTQAQASFQPDPFADGPPDQFLYGADPSEHAPVLEAEPPASTQAFESGQDPDYPGAEEEPENFLSQARRTARAAAEKAETERQTRGFRWGAAAASAGSEERPRYLIPAVIALIVLLAVAAGLVLSQRLRAPAPATPAPKTAVDNKGPDFSMPQPPAGDETQFVVAPSAESEQGPQGAGQESGPPNSAQPLQQRNVRQAPVNSVPDRAPARQSSADRVVQLADANNAIAQTILGLRYLDGTGGTAVNLPQAVKYLTAAANQGQAVAQYRLGTLYERGQGVPADSAKAAHWYQASANQGNRKAMHNLAVAYASGSIGKKNMPEAARWFAKAAALGLSDSQFNLAVLYERGDGVPQSLLDAFKWYSIAAASGDTESKARVTVLQSQLSDADRATAQKSAATFHAAPLNRSANVPPELADLG